MVSPTIRDELLERLDRLPIPLQRRVLDFADALAQTKRPQGAPGKNLLELAGLFDKESLREMKQAIDEDCERIDPNEW